MPCAITFVFFIVLTASPFRFAHAISIALVPSAQEVSVGDSLEIDIVVSDPILGATLASGDFDGKTRFDPTVLQDTTESPFPDDPSILRPTDSIFGGHLGIPGTETTTYVGVYENVSLEIVRTAEFSTLTAQGLLNLQSPSFVLATLYFEALALGSSTIEFSSVSIGGPCSQLASSGGCIVSGPRLSVTSIGSTNIIVTAVPIPPAIYLFGSGLLVIIGVVNKKREGSNNAL